jgi:hypothetical protein
LLVKSGLLLIADSVEQPLTITTGFPYSTYRIYKDLATEFLKKTHIIEYDASTHSSNGKRSVILDVQNVEVIPEIARRTIALRKGFKNEFGEVAQLEFVADPATLASKGYALNSLRVSGGKKNSSVGLDIGNATTVVTTITE